MYTTNIRCIRVTFAHNNKTHHVLCDFMPTKHEMTAHMREDKVIDKHDRIVAMIESTFDEAITAITKQSYSVLRYKQ